MALSRGTRLGPYEIGETLGAGGMGEVYRAVDTRLNRTVAIKIIASGAVSDAEGRKRFLTEARAASALNHRNIVTIHDIGEADGVGFLVMELVPGRPLGSFIAPGGMQIARVVDHGLQIAEALEAAHSAGIIHRDIKPANVMATESGTIKVLDFGVSKVLQPVSEDALTTAGTAAGQILGTLAYMSPEQLQGRPVDARSDVFSLGAVLYELLTGRRAFEGEGSLSLVSSILTEQPPAVAAIRRDVSPDLAALVQACLAKDREARPTAREVVARLTAIRDRLAPKAAPVPLLRRPAVLISFALIVLAAGVAGWLWWRSTSGARWVRDIAIPEIERLIARDDYDGAFRMTRDALAVLPDDPFLKQRWTDITFLVNLDTDPSGADVAVRGYLAHDKEWIPIGRTPLAGVRVPYAHVRVRITKPGFTPVDASLGNLDIKYKLDAVEATPPGMVRAQAVVGVVGTEAVQLGDYWIDRLEVTNQQYKAFVDRGGYEKQEYWKEPFVDGDRTLSFAEAMTRVRDATGRPGPSTWELSTFPEGQASFPVSGVSWYEAAAYCLFAGKSLPTAYHWRGASGSSSGFTVNFSEILNVSNFSSKGPVPVGTRPGLSAIDAYDMAGNVKEWTASETGGKRLILGGGFNEPSYMFNDPDAQPPFDRLPAYGFRCVKYGGPVPDAATRPITFATRDVSTERPVSDELFDAFRNQYRYDATPLAATLESTEDAPAWRKETISFDAAYGKERIRAYLFLPRNAVPPYQAIVYFPPGDALFLRSSRELRMNTIDFLIRSGRALMFPIYKGTYERGPAAAAGSAGARDLIVQRSKDLGRSIDYLATRPDIDSTRLGYYGISLGATVGSIVTAIEPRFRASILVSGGLTAARPLPDADPLNFAPRIKVPTLMVNGRGDFAFQYDRAQLPLYKLIGTDPKDKDHKTFNGGHIPLVIHDMIKEILDWYDKYLGPVKATGAG